MDGSALVSPLSVMTAMLMTANGAKGQTLREMTDTLFDGMTLEEANAQLYNCYAALSNTENASLEDANAVFFSDRDDFTVSPEFIELVRDTFDAAVAEADFTDPGTVDVINEWCRDHTADMIKKVLEYEDVSTDTIMVLLNALCFNALWETQYEDCQVRDQVFRGTAGDQNVKMMYGEDGGYIKGGLEEGFVKYYKGGKYAFAALLPEKGMDITDYLETLGNGRLKALLESRKGRVKTGIPQFKYDMALDLAEQLQDMGIVTAFSNNSDLSGLGRMDDDSNLKISKVIHKTHIEVDPSGTKAAAVTAVVVEKVTSIGPDDLPEVILDRPFVYMIIDTTSMLPVFMGTLGSISG
ncbi:MAG: serpin family protein [Clostridia bacterium]|nr:serpin family protein [Clostridia bacterium]